MRTDSTIPNNKPEVIIRGNKKGTHMLIDVADRTVIKKEAEKILKYKDLTIEIQRMWNVKAKNDTGNNRGDRNHFKIPRTIPDQHNGIARN